TPTLPSVKRTAASSASATRLPIGRRSMRCSPAPRTPARRSPTGRTIVHGASILATSATSTGTCGSSSGTHGSSVRKREVGNGLGGIAMGKVVFSENVTLDGVVQDPSGDEGLRVGGWIGRVGDRGREEAAGVLLDEALGAEALLFGRRSYEFFAARWPSRSGALADRLNSLHKYIGS